MNLSNLICSPINDPIIDISIIDDFCCGRSELDDFLKKDALNFHNDNITKTTLVFHPDVPKLLAYFSLSSDVIRLQTSEQTELGLNYDTQISFYPAIKITKLAVAENMQSKSVGSQLIEIILGMVNTINKHSAVRLITVDAVNNERTISFYQKVGFKENLTDKKEKDHKRHKQTILMFKDIQQ